MTKATDTMHEKDRVSHTKFGAGTIKEVGSRYITIMFDDHGLKKFLTQMVQLERSDVPPRPKPVKTAQAESPKTAK